MMKLFSHKSVLASSIAIVISLTATSAIAKSKKPVLSGASALMLSNTCAGCHGAAGASNGPSIPTIGGMSETYFEETMQGYKSGDIPSTIMGRLAKGYTDKEIKQMGKYFAKQSFVDAKNQASDSAQAKKGAKIHKKYCEKCHSEEGTLAEDDSGFLKGQWKSYLVAQMMDFHNKDRQSTKKMTKKMKKMYKKHGDAGVKALIEFYSSK